MGPLPCLNFSLVKRGPGPAIVSSTLYPAVHILGSFVIVYYQSKSRFISLSLSLSRCFCLSLSLFICLCLGMYLCLCLSVSVCLSVSLSVCLSFCLFVCLSVPM